jgi:hypothetical protein
MTKSFKYIALLAMLFAVTACQKVIDLKLDSAQPQIVIEGNFTNQKGSQVVSISQSVPITNTNNFPPVSGAIVTVAESKGSTYTLTETNIPGTYTVNNVAGKPGSTYTLTVKLNGQTYTSVSTMPAMVNFAALTVEDDAFNKGSKAVGVHFNDPAGIANQYRFVLYVNGTQIKDIYTTDDTYTDGSRMDIDLYQNDVTIKSKDQLIVESEGIDRNVFYYWFSLSQQQGDGVANGAAPANPPSNISGGALGYFSAHTSVIQLITVK